MWAFILVVIFVAWAVIKIEKRQKEILIASEVRAERLEERVKLLETQHEDNEKMINDLSQRIVDLEERWFRSLKTEKIYPNEFASPRELRKGLIDYINEYNKVRPHEALAYRTPDSYYYGQNVA